MIHFKPTDFVDRTDPQVLGRRDDYRSPDSLAVAVGSGWNENAADADFFNESEGAYTLNFDPAGGLQFDMNGSAIRRRQPFFKIRQWRSLVRPTFVSVEGLPLAADLDYRADVKPLSRGHFASELLWHSTLDSPAEVTNPDVGSPGAVNGGASFSSARYGSGASFSTPTSYVSFPAGGNLRVDRGAVELWYLPSYYYVDGTGHRIWSYFVDAANQFHLTKEASNNLAFEILRGGVSTKVSITPANYGWLDFEWVHLRVTWDAAAPVADQARIFVNRVEPPHTSPTNAYNAGLMPPNGTVFIGGSGGLSTDGIIDELHVNGAPTADLAHGGLDSNLTEYLATPTRDFQFPLVTVDALERGAYLYFGADSRFRGLNVSLASPGNGSLDLAWEYWNGSRWADLESGTGFTDETVHLTRSGAIFWSLDPAGWSELSVDGDADLFYVRAHLRSGSYASYPREKEIRTDLLLFQYQKDVAAAAQTFTFQVPPAYDVSISSASNQTFPVGAATPLSPVSITVSDLLGGSITAADDIRIRIPAGLPIRWDSSIASASLAGGAAAKVNPTILAYEDMDKTLVLNVVTDFAAGEQLAIAGLGLEGFLHPASPDNLELEVDNDGSTSAFDDKTIAIAATANPNLSSHDNQIFVVGQAATLAETLYVTEGLAGGVLTVANGFEVVIPAGFPMEWNNTVGSVVLSGPGASRVSTAVTYPTLQIARFTVTSNFAPGEHVVIDGLQFRTFSAAAAPNNLRLHSPTGTGVDTDDKTIQIAPTLDAPFFTATATDFQVRLEWVNPSLGTCLNIHIVRKEGSFPANPADGFPVVGSPLPCFPGNRELLDDTAGLANDTTYYYTLFVEYATFQFTPGKRVKARPFDTSGRVKWAYSTGATAMAPPGLRFYGGNVFVYAVSNDNVLHAVDGGVGGGSWPLGWIPYSVGAPVQSRPPVLGFAVGGSPQGIALLGAQDGRVHAVNAETGQPEWVESIASMVQAAPAGNFSAFDPTALDLVLVGTRNSSGTNALMALDLVSGAAQWGFDNSVPQNGDGLDIGIISSSATVHYGTKRVFFASRTRSGGSPDTLWAVDFAPNPPQLLWSKSIGNIDGSPVLSSGVLYVGTNAGKLVALDALTGSENWSLPLGDGAIKGFVFPSTTGNLFVSTSTKIWSVTTGGAFNPGWPVVAASVPSPSTPIVLPGGLDVLAGSSDGRLHQLDTVSPIPTASVILGDGTAAVGSPSVDLLNTMVYVGTDQGVIYGVLLPLP
jgi:outer membrane protein assembly factor BamB